MSSITQLFSYSTNAVFGIDGMNRIRFCNELYEDLLGYSQDEVIGKSCASVLCGVDLHGDPFCSDQCPIPKILNGPPKVEDVDLIVKRKDNDSIWINIGAHYVTLEQQEKNDNIVVFFSLRRVNCQRLLKRLASENHHAAMGHNGNSNGISRYGHTPKELKVLSLSVTGLSTKQIAENMCISTETVRNHFRGIYTKLDVHSRAEAVVLAIRYNLVD